MNIRFAALLALFLSLNVAVPGVTGKAITSLTDTDSKHQSLKVGKEDAADTDDEDVQMGTELYGALASMVLVGAALLGVLYIQKRKSKLPTITNIYPNPSTDGIIHIDFENAKEGQLQIVDFADRVIQTINISGHQAKVDLSRATDGDYVAIIIAEGKPSNGYQFSVRR